MLHHRFYTLFAICLLLGSGCLSAQELILQDQINLGGGTDIWGYVDDQGNEYAIVGSNGISIVDVNDPEDVFRTAYVNNVPSFDHKVWGHYVYTVTGGPGSNGGKIIDISDVYNPSVVGSFESSHNVFITETGYMVAEFSNPRLIIYDLNIDPTDPTPIWTGGVEGHDATVIGNRLYDFHGSAGTNIYDITNIESPFLLTSINDPTITYHHQGWTDIGNDYLYICDELANGNTPDITIWDIRSMENPEKVGGYTDVGATVHNLYVKGHYAYTSYYSAGLRIFDISRPDTLVVAAENNTIGSTWGVYPFLPSGTILASGGIGLHVFSFDGALTGIAADEENTARNFNLAQNYPNPFNPETTIGFRMSAAGVVELAVYDISGRLVKTLLNEKRAAGSYEVQWDGRNRFGAEAPSGVYIYRLRAGNYSAAKRMLLVR